MTENCMLIADDNLVNRMVIEKFFTRFGWTVVTAERGDEALEKALATKPDLVMLDISMPGMRGDEVCRALRGEQDFASRPIIAYTAHAQESDIEGLKAAGFDQVLIKPVNSGMLKAVDEKYRRV